MVAAPAPAATIRALTKKDTVTMQTRTHNLVGQVAAGVCASRAVSVSARTTATWSATYAQTIKPVMGMFADHANLPARRPLEPSP